MAEGTKEIHFERHIEDYLLEHGYHAVSPLAYDKETCLIQEEVIAFLQESQPNQYQKVKEQLGDLTNEKIIAQLSKSLKSDKQKTLSALKNRFRVSGQKFVLAYFKPQNDKTPEHEEGYKKNRFAIVRQVPYSIKNNNTIDIVLFLNGMPLVTLELKNALTGQNHYNAIKQYMIDRDPKGEPFLEFTRCLVHFAVGTEKVFMTTRLNGKSTFFLPFNKELVNHNPNGFAVSYLWEDVLSTDSLLDLVQNFISVQTDEKLIYDPKIKGLKSVPSTKLLFPRYHQRRAVNRLINQLREDGTGKNYLIQHSAGSGKSNTITWLAYKLANIYRNYDDEKGMFSSVFVVTDRRVLNRQIQNNIQQLDRTPGMIAYLGDNSTSQDLKQAIEEGKKIIITTIQKFPIISDTVAAYGDRNYAILIDEAHSSQSGETSRHMRKALSLHEAEEADTIEKTVDDIIADEIARKGQQPNISQFAFTATPKPKTLNVFGTLKDGERSAFDEYTMEQAIKEGFILDVLQNYMSFKRYYKLVKKGDVPDKEYEKKKAVQILSNYVDLKDHAIETKSRIMIEHFASHTQNEIQGEARAMLVTRSRLHAVRYKRKFDEILREMRLPYEALVAFSGSVKDSETGEEYTEKSMNNIGSNSIPEALKLPKYRILIVANKFQTGFDEPLMHTMFVDKKLGGANTVQTLSRLNRTTKGKNSTMVLDFVNDPDKVREDFQHFYGKNFMDEQNAADPNALYLLLNEIEAHHVFYENEVEKFAQIFFSKEDNFELIQPILNAVSERYAEQLNEEDQQDFKTKVRSFTKLYRFLTQIMTFTDVDLEKHYMFFTALLKKLPYTISKLPINIVNDVDLESYKIQHQYTTNLALESGDSEDKGIMTGGSINKPEDENDFLSHIIKTLNDTFGADLTDEDKVDYQKVMENLRENTELMSYFNNQNSKDNIQDKLNEEVDNELLNFINTKLDFYNKMTEDRVNSLFKRMIFNEMYDTMVRGIR